MSATLSNSGGAIHVSSGSTTTSVVQGIAKHWAHITGDGTPSLLDSLNCSSVTDHAVAWIGSNLTNNMNDTNGSFFGQGRETSVIVYIQEITVGTANNTNSWERSTSAAVSVTHTHVGPAQADMDGRHHMLVGDLA